jgi:hypothetical protein
LRQQQASDEDQRVAPAQHRLTLGHGDGGHASASIASNDS